jgi:hypothetical protein
VSYKRGLAVVIGSVVAALVSYAATWPRFHTGHAVVAVAGVPVSAPLVETSIATAFAPLPGHDDPLAWSHLSDEQHTALAPFAPEWDKFSDERRRKWLRIAARYPKMSPDQQRRLHERMAEWVRMTPEQRRVARENYQVSKTLPPQARQRAWKDYQQLPPDQKARLAASEHKRRTVVSAPPTGGKREIRDIERLVKERDHRGQPRTGAAPAARATGASAASGAKAASTAAATPATASAPSSAPTTPSLPPVDTSSVYKGS